MANNYYQATVSPDLPANLFSAEEIHSLESACGLTADRVGEDVYFFAEECFCAQGEDADGFGVDCPTFLQGKLRQLNPAAYPRIVIHGASTCSKMRPDEFGGFAIVITRDDIRSTSTWEWLAQALHEDRPRAAHRVQARSDVLPAAEAGTIRIEVAGGVVQDVSNVPPGWVYEIIDHDNLESKSETVASAASNIPGRFEIEHNPQENPDRVYVLVDGEFDVAIIRTGEGVVVDIYPKDGVEPIASTYAFNSHAHEPGDDAAPCDEA